MMTNGATLPQPVERRCPDCHGTFKTDNLNRVVCGHCTGVRRPPKRNAERAPVSELTASVDALFDRLSAVEAQLKASDEELKAMAYRLSVAVAERKILRRRIRRLERIDDKRLLPRTSSVLDSIVVACAEAFDLTPKNLKSQSRLAAYARARFAYYLLARELTRCGGEKIGRAVHRGDHTTVLHGLRRASQMERRDPDFAARLAAARELLAHLDAGDGDA